MEHSSDYQLIIEPGKIEKEYYKDLWRYRELFFFLSWREILVRYKQTVLGISWAVIRPLLTMIVFTFIFGKLARLPSNGIPYPLIVMAGMLPWQLFAAALTESSNSLISNSNLISKIYFPRLIIPVSLMAVSLIDFFVSLVIFIVLLVIYGYIPDMKILMLPLFVFLGFCTAMSVGIWFSSLNVRYRDIRYLVPFIVQFGLYISPVGFLSDIIPQKFRLIYSLNPMAGVIDGFRWVLLGKEYCIYWPGLMISLIFVIILLWSGTAYFRKTEKSFADMI